MFIRNVFMTLSTEFFTLGGNFLAGILLARGLSVPERGIMVLVMSLPWTVASLANLGLPQANIYLVGRKKYDPKTVLGSSLAAALGLGLLTVLGMLAMRETILNTALRGLPPEYYPLLLALIPLLLVDGVLLSILRARQRFDLFNLRRLASTLFLLVGFSSALLLARGGLNLVVWVYLGATLLLVAAGVLLTRREVPLTLRLDLHFTGDSLRFGFKSYLQNLAGALTYRLDVYLLAFFLAPEQVAFYAVATALAEVAWYIPDTVGVVLFPRLSNAPVEEVYAITARVCRNAIFITVIVVLVMAGLSWFLVPLIYGAAYVSSVQPLLILLPGIVFMGIYKVLTRNYSSRNRQQVSIVAAVTALIINVILNLILIPRWGVAGAALASTLGYTSAGLTLLAFFIKDSGFSWTEVLLPKGAELLGHVQWAKSALHGRWNKVRV